MIIINDNNNLFHLLLFGLQYVKKKCLETESCIDMSN